jgi:hypothetical protein
MSKTHAVPAGPAWPGTMEQSNSDEALRSAATPSHEIVFTAAQGLRPHMVQCGTWCLHIPRPELLTKQATS